jgi:hypothetical protein
VRDSKHQRERLPERKPKNKNLKMKNTSRIEAKTEIKAILQNKFLKLVKAGMSEQAAFADVMGAFEQQFPGLLEKLK